MKNYKKVKKNFFKNEERIISKITEILAAITLDENGNEGLISSINLESFPPIEKPLIAINKNEKNNIMEIAKMISNKHGIVIKICKFIQCDILTEFKPEKNVKMN
jgi:hypothetical protein